MEGFDLHVNVCVGAYDRARQEQLCRYLLRPPLADDRLPLLGDGRVRVQLKRAWSDATTHLLFEPVEFLEKRGAHDRGRRSTWPEAEAHLHRSIEVARCHRAKSLELRAVTSLYRLWAHQGRVSKARAWLAGVYGWFREGLDTGDLTDARSLLEALGQQAEQPPERDGDQEPA